MLIIINKNNKSLIFKTQEFTLPHSQANYLQIQINTVLINTKKM